MDAQTPFEQSNNIEEEIRHLEKALAEKKAAFEGHKKEQERFPHREALHEIVKEKYIQPSDDAQALAQQGASLPSAQIITHAQQLAPLKSRQRVQQLVEMVFDKGIYYAMDVAKNLDPYTLDEFHHALVDKLYEEMVKRGIVKEV